MIVLGVPAKEYFTNDSLSSRTSLSQEQLIRVLENILVKSGTAGGSKDKRTPFDKAWDQMKACCIGCCKCPQQEKPEEVSEEGGPASQVKKKHLFEVNRLEKASNASEDNSGVVFNLLMLVL